MTTAARIKMAEDGAWKLLLALGAFLWLVALGMQIDVHGQTWARLSTGKFVIVMGCGGLALLVGSALRVWSLQQIVRVELAVGAAQKELTLAQPEQTRTAVEEQGKFGDTVAERLQGA